MCYQNRQQIARRQERAVSSCHDHQPFMRESSEEGKNSVFCDGRRGRTQANVDMGGKVGARVSKGKEWEGGIVCSRKPDFHWSYLLVY